MSHNSFNFIVNEGYVACFQSWAIANMDKAAMNISVQTSA